MTSLYILLQAGGGAAFSPLFLLAMVVVMYFFMLRPNFKKQKEQKAFNAQIAVGQKVVTIGGIHGKIIAINPDGTMKLEGDRNTYFTVEANAISMESTQAMEKRNAPTPVTEKA
ncbi:MAG: preprotein translocase subunit YajC [Bacteroidota bacterium]|jgi:preprotein translocase subunit YajC